MGFKDKVRNSQNAEHATVEDYQKSMQEKHMAERAARGKNVPITAAEPCEEESVKQVSSIEQVENITCVAESVTITMTAVEPLNETVKETSEELVINTLVEKVMPETINRNKQEVVKNSPLVEKPAKPVKNRPAQKKKDSSNN